MEIQKTSRALQKMDLKINTISEVQVMRTERKEGVQPDYKTLSESWDFKGVFLSK